jgi:signal transduction histidine kinase
LKARFADENIKCVLNLRPGILPLEADPAQLHQVIVNLVVNAIQATPRGGTVTISTEGDDEYVYLTVEDTGCGMSEDVRRQIFLPFFTTKDVGHGTGLGLAVVHGIVEAHGGTIGVHSEVGRGSRFVIILPLRGEGDAGAGGADAQG